MKWSPLKAALVTFAVVLGVGLVAGLALSSQIHDHAYERGQKFGQGLATFSVFAAAVAYLVQKKRLA